MTELPGWVCWRQVAQWEELGRTLHWTLLFQLPLHLHTPFSEVTCPGHKSIALPAYQCRSLLVISIPRTFWIFEARSSSLPAFLLALPYTLIKWWVSNASQQRRQIKFRRWTFVRVDSSVNTHTFQNFAISTQQKWQVSLGDFRYVLGKLITINLMYFWRKALSQWGRRIENRNSYISAHMNIW